MINVNVDATLQNVIPSSVGMWCPQWWIADVRWLHWLHPVGSPFRVCFLDSRSMLKVSMFVTVSPAKCSPLCNRKSDEPLVRSVCRFQSKKLGLAPRVDDLKFKWWWFYSKTIYGIIFYHILSYGTHPFFTVNSRTHATFSSRTAVGLSWVARCAPVTAAHADSPRWTQQSVKLGHFWDLELGKGAWKIAGMELQIRVFLCFFSGLWDMLWYLPMLWNFTINICPWVGSNVDGPSGGYCFVISPKWCEKDSCMEPPGSQMKLVVDGYLSVGQTSKSGGFQFQRWLIHINTMWYQHQIHKPLGCQISGKVQPTVVWNSSPSWESQESLVRPGFGMEPNPSRHIQQLFSSKIPWYNMFDHVVPAPSGISWFSGSTGVTMKFCLRAMLGFSVPWWWSKKMSAGCHGFYSKPKWISMDCLTMVNNGVNDD